MKSKVLLILIFIIYSCKSSKVKHHEILSENLIENSLYENKESEYKALQNAIYDKYQEASTLVLFNGKEITLSQMGLMRKKIDSTYSIQIIRDSIQLKKRKISRKYKTLITIYN